MFRNRERMTRFLVIFISTMMVLAIILPFIASLSE